VVYDVNLALPCVPMIIEEPRAGKLRLVSGMHSHPLSQACIRRTRVYPAGNAASRLGSLTTLAPVLVLKDKWMYQMMKILDLRNRKLERVCRGALTQYIIAIIKWCPALGASGGKNERRITKRVKVCVIFVVFLTIC